MIFNKKFDKNKEFATFIDSKAFKIGGVVVGSLLALYLIGHVFHIAAHTVRGYKSLTTALKS